MSEINHGDAQTAWREGDRIRCTSGMGYGDMVADDDIQAHIRANPGDSLFVAFACAVLAIRSFERESSR